MNETGNVGLNNTGINNGNVQTPSIVPNPNLQPNASVQNSTPVIQNQNSNVVTNQGTVIQNNMGVNQATPNVVVPQGTVQPIDQPVNQNSQTSSVAQTVSTPQMVSSTPTLQVLPTLEQMSTPISSPVQTNSNIQIQMSNNLNASSIKEESKREKEEKNKKKTNGESDELSNENVNRAPIILVAIFIGFLVVLFVYYFVIMTPTRVFDKAIDNIFNNIKSVVNGIEYSESDRLRFDLGFDLDTDQTANAKYSGQLESVDYIDSDYLEGIIDLDIKNSDLKIRLRTDKKVSNLKKLGLDDLIEDEKAINQQMLDFSIYSVEDQTYIGPIDYINYNDIENFGKEKIKISKPIKMDIFDLIFDSESNITFNFDKIDSIINIVEITKNKIVDMVEDKELKRTIAVKRVGGTTAIALKASASVDHKRIEDIYKSVFRDYVNNNPEELNGKSVDILKEFMNVTGLSEQETKDFILKLYERDVVTQNIDVNLYMNLANTELVSLEVKIDNKYNIQISYLNGYYQFHIETVSDGKQVFVLDASYDQYNGLVNGLGVIDNENTILAVEFDYERKENEKGRKTGNSLNFKFYNNDTYKLSDDKKLPLSILLCKLDIYESANDVTNTANFDLKEEVSGALEGPGRYGTDLEKFKTNFISHIDYLFDHLLYNKGDAAQKRKRLSDSTKSNDKTNTVTEENNEIINNDENQSQENEILEKDNNNLENENKETTNETLELVE